MQQGGSPYGAPPPHPPSQQSQHHQQQQTELSSPFSAPPISTRPPPLVTVGGSLSAAPAVPNYEDLGSAGDDVLGPAGDDGGSGSLSGNRWPRQETLALLKIRSDMDAAFKDATLKGPLWEEVSRKLAELGYRRNAKKCKEKFENVHKYYKRTKEGRAGRQDGKSYRFFTQLEALHNTTTTAAGGISYQPQLPAIAVPSAAVSPTPVVSSAINSPPILMATTPPSAAAPPRIQPMQISAPTPITTAPPAAVPVPVPVPVQGAIEHPSTSTVAAAAAGAAAAGISFSSNTSSSASEGSESDDEATEEGPSRESGGGGEGKKRKREEGGSSGGRGSRKMMAFFEGLMRQVMERQETMQQRFLESIEKREQERMIREEAWRRQEMSRMAREHELAAQERAAAAARDATIISFLQKVTGQTVPVPKTIAPPIQAPPTSAPPPQIQQQQTPPRPPPQPPAAPQPVQPQQQQQNTEIVVHHHHTPPPPPPPAATSTELVPMGSNEGAMVSAGLDPASSSRWPKSEVHALIKLRSGLDPRYQESGPKGPLWEEISAGMQRLGYSRSAKRCKEKWENINKYFKKVKESNKKRPEDAKTCPYFHQLDALYRSKQMNSAHRQQEHDTQSIPNLNPAPVLPSPSPAPAPAPSPISMAPPAQQQQQLEENKNGNSGGSAGPGPSNGGMAATFFGEATGESGGMIMKKPEDIMKELMMGQPNNNSNNDYGKLDESDDMDDDLEDDEEYDDDEDDEDGKGQYRIQFQRQNVGPNAAAAGSGGAATTNGSGGKPTSGSFLAMVR